MNERIYSIITGSGSYIPSITIKNEHFLDYSFFDPATRLPLDRNNQEIIEKFREITSIEERRVCTSEETTSSIGTAAALDAIESSGIDPESLDFILVGHNFGEMQSTNLKSEMVPCIASKIKQRLGLKNPGMFTHDVIAGCPGWVQALIIADLYLKSGQYKRGPFTWRPESFGDCYGAWR